MNLYIVVWLKKLNKIVSSLSKIHTRKKHTRKKEEKKKISMKKLKTKQELSPNEFGYIFIVFYKN